MHPRQAIRNAVTAALARANTAAGSRVYASRKLPIESDSDLPAICVYTTSESSDEQSAFSFPRELKRTLNLQLEVVVLSPDNVAVDDAIDSLAEQIENAMNIDETFGGACSYSYLASSDLQVSEIGAQQLAELTLVYNVVFYTYGSDAADATLVPLKTVDAKYDANGVVIENDQAEDLLTGLDT